MSKAEFSNRASAKVTLSFTIPVPNTDVEVPVQVPIALYSGVVSEHGVKRTQFVRVKTGTKTEKVTDIDSPDFGKDKEVDVFEDHPVGSQNYNKTTGDTVAYSEIIKKIATDHGAVYVTDDEIERLFEISPDTVVVKAFQPLHLFHQGKYVPKGLQYVEPLTTGSGKKKGHDAGAVKMLGTLFGAMRDKGACAIVEITTRGIPKPGVLLPDGTLWFVFHTDEQREQREVKLYDPSEGELMAFGAAIDAKWSTDVVDLTDERSALIQNFADEKAAAGDFGPVEAVEVDSAPKPAEGDVMALLMASIEAAQAKQASA